MNISPDGVTVRFTIINDDALFNAEKSGAKSNTVRIIDQYDRERLRKQLPQKIIIQNQDEIFLRTLTNVYVSDRVLGKYLAVFSWTNEKHHYHTARENESCIGDHNLSIDEEPEIDTTQSDISLPRTLINELIGLADNLSSMLKGFVATSHQQPSDRTVADGDDDKNKGEERYGI